ncbi:MAG: hypothetical protein NTW13_04995 [Candidatus Omnitrophica bacterium]|nr:hypothetical protein [Candidatus Omnitrophota bacterium]
MGVTHKLKPEIRNFILEQKKSNPTLSCRNLSNLAQAEFKIEVSKSSINAVIKEAGLSAPIGRKPKKARPHIIMPSLPILLRPQDTALEIIKVDLQRVSQPQEEAKPRAEEEEQKVKEEEARRQEEKKQLEDEREKAENEAARQVEEARWRKQAEEEQRVQEEAAGGKQQEEAAKLEIEAKVKLSPQIENSGIVLLRAADYLIAGTSCVSPLISKGLNQPQSDILIQAENLLYSSLLEDNIGKSSLTQLQLTQEMNQEISRILLNALQEVRCIKITLANKDTLYLDGQLYTIWSTPYLPYDFSASISNIKSRINKCFYENSLCLIFMAPGYDMPSKEFFNLVSGFNSRGNGILNLTLYGNKLEELAVISSFPNKKHFFVLAMWPWQFTESRKINKIGEFTPVHLGAEAKEFYLAEIELELSQPQAKETVTLRGCVLKTSPNEKARLIILSNADSEGLKSQELANAYISRWPNLEEAFQDYSRKVELFTYTANAQRFFSTENLSLSQNALIDTKSLLESYLKALDLYLRLSFMPAGYEERDLITMQERFYSLKANIKPQNDCLIISFQPEPGYGFLKDLSYLCRRLNEKGVYSGENKLLYFTIA